MITRSYFIKWLLIRWSIWISVKIDLFNKLNAPSARSDCVWRPCLREDPVNQLWVTLFFAHNQLCRILDKFYTVWQAFWKWKKKSQICLYDVKTLEGWMKVTKKMERTRGLRKYSKQIIISILQAYIYIYIYIYRLGIQCKKYKNTRVFPCNISVGANDTCILTKSVSKNNFTLRMKETCTVVISKNEMLETIVNIIVKYIT